MLLDAINNPSIFKQNTEIFEVIYEKTACALIAIRNLIHDHHESLKLAKADKFLEEYDFIFQTSPDILTSVWIDPTTFFWVHSTYELIKYQLTGKSFSQLIGNYFADLENQGIKNLLEFQISEFKKIVLGVAYLSHQDYQFKTPLSINLPFAIPGTALYLASDKPSYLKIEGIINQKIKFSENDSHCNHIKLKKCPIILHKNHQFKLQIYSFNLSSFTEAKPLLKAGISYQEEQIKLIKNSLDLIADYQPHIYTQLAEFIQILGVKPLKSGEYTNLSYSDIPGAIICSVIHNPFEFADTLIHEFFHNRLFCIEEIHPILNRTSEQLSLKYYSPWRDDLRPMTGILHAVYVYLAVAHFWLAVYERKAVKSDIFDYTTSQIIRINFQLKIGISQLKKFGDFTDYGQKFLKLIEEDFKKIQAQTVALNVPPDFLAFICQENGEITQKLSAFTKVTLITVKSEILEHLQQFDCYQQCDGLI